LEIAVIFAIFFVQGAWPVPEVNEAHYLGKAVHFWNPAWMQNDFFLESADPHWGFYAVFGWLSFLVSRWWMAWIGRSLTWALLAWSWQRMSFAFVARRGFAILSAAMFAGLTEHCHMGGEWVIGGVEAKGFAFVFLFLGLEALIRQRWSRVWLCFGVASAFHVLVGGWACAAAGIGWLALGRRRPPLSTMWPALVIGGLMAMPSLVGAIRLDWGVDASTANLAHRIYVFYRLPHHLFLFGIDPLLILRFALLIGVWAILRRALGDDDASIRLGAFVTGALTIAFIGCMLSVAAMFQPAIAADWLRFYWFRISDVAVPLGVALAATKLLDRVDLRNPAVGRRWIVAAAAAATLYAGGYGVFRAFPTPPRSDLKVEFVGWRLACQWVANSGEIPRNARFLTPFDAQTFSWYANRSQVVSRKDLPQDAKSVVQWWTRLNDIYATGSNEPGDEWHTSLNQLGEKRLLDLAEKYDADYLITDTNPRLNFTMLYRNRSYTVYRLRDPQLSP
jgi:hypothetical protein